MAMLEVSQLNVQYGEVRVLENLNLTVDKGNIVAITGTNGSGKTSVLNAIAGIHPPSSGSIIFSNEKIHGLPTHQIVGKGLVLVPEGRQLFPTLTVQENLMAGLHSKGGLLLKKKLPQDLLKRFPIIKNRLNTSGAGLSGGQAQLIALARGLISKPKLLLLDEPTLGLAPIAVKEFFDLILKLREEGQTILMVEQNLKQTLEIADYGYVLESGKLVMQGSGNALLKNSGLVENYLGFKNT